MSPFADSVHEALEGLCCILKAEGCTQELEKAERRDDGRLADVRWRDRDLVIPTY